LNLTPKATSRLNFASGALKAAKFIANQKPKLFDMQEVLNLK
jgi:4-hydroxy-tetrahydrodipicolinate reductase